MDRPAHRHQAVAGRVGELGRPGRRAIARRVDGHLHRLGDDRKFCADKGKTVDYTFPSRGHGHVPGLTTTASPRTPNPDVAYELCNRIISVEAAGSSFARAPIQAIVNPEAVPLLPPDLRGSYRYDDIGVPQAGALLRLPADRAETAKSTTYGDWLKEYQRLSRPERPWAGGGRGGCRCGTRADTAPPAGRPCVIFAAFTVPWLLLRARLLAGRILLASPDSRSLTTPRPVNYWRRAPRHAADRRSRRPR